MRSPPMHYRCPACGWSKTVALRSDVLAQGDFYNACPQCASTSLDLQPAGTAAGNVLGGSLAQMAQSLERLWKSR